MRLKALGPLHDQRLIGEVALHGGDDIVRYEAGRQITDQALIADVAKNAKEHKVRRAKEIVDFSK